MDDLRAFDINADQWKIVTQDEGKWRRTAEQGAERFMVKWNAAEKAKAGLRYAVVCPNVTGRIEDRIVQSKRACAGSLAIVDYCSHKWRELVFFGRLVCRCHFVFLWCYVCFVSFSSVCTFIEAAALCPDRYACVPTATCVFPEYFCIITVFSSYGGYVVRVFLPGDVFLPCDHGLDF